MRIFRFMSKEEFQNYLKGEEIAGKFVKGKACFLEENVPAREKEDSVKQLTDLPLDFKSEDFEGQMKELSELISPIFKNGNFEGKLKDLENLSLADFMSTIRENVTADVLVEFQPKEEFEKEYNKVVMSYQKYLIEEVQSNGYSRDTLDCISYKIDLINGFKNGIGIDTATKHEFESAEQTLADLEQAEKEKNAIEEVKTIDIEDAKELLSDEKFAYYGHGTGRNGNDEATIKSIFNQGLRAKDNSLYWTSQEMGLGGDMQWDDFKEYLDNWQHMDSKNIILMRLPAEYINIYGNEPEGAEKLHAFYVQRQREDGKMQNYLNTKFIIGCYNSETREIQINPNFEEELSKETIEELKKGFEESEKMVEERLEREESGGLFGTNTNNIIEEVEEEIDDEDWLDWDDNTNAQEDGINPMEEEIEQQEQESIRDEIGDEFKPKTEIQEQEEQQIRTELMNNPEIDNEELTISEKDIGKATINAETQKKDMAQKQMQQDLQKMQEISRNR